MPQTDKVLVYRICANYTRRKEYAGKELSLLIVFYLAHNIKNKNVRDKKIQFA